LISDSLKSNILCTRDESSSAKSYPRKHRHFPASSIAPDYCPTTSLIAAAFLKESFVMKRVVRSYAGCLLALAILAIPQIVKGQTSVLTQHNDLGRTGQNLNETVLNASNVNVNNFGKLFTRNVDGYIYAQPLYAPNLNIQGATRNVVYVATMHNSVYAFDADDPNASAPLWQVNLGTSVPSQDICSYIPDPLSCPYLDVIPEIGIQSTPVIDPATGTIYVIAKTVNAADSTYHFKLHALDIRTGAEKFGGPVEIAGQVNGTGTASVNGVLTFDPLVHLNRPGLLLMNGAIFAAFGSVGDIGDFHGWVFRFRADTLQQTAIFCTSPNGHEAGIWQGGGGLIGQGNSIYFISGDGSFDPNSGNFGDTYTRLDASTLSVLDYFTPYNQLTLDQGNKDLGSGGPMALPGTSLIVGIGKDGTLRVVDTNNMGQYNASFNNNVQEFTGTASVFMGSPIYWNSPNLGPLVYLWSRNDYLKAYQFNGLFNTTPALQGTVPGTTGYSNSVPLSLSANGSQAGTGIIWAAAPYSGNTTSQTVPGILYAFNASTLQELWDSKQNAARDDVGNYAKFCPPTIANGKVYVPTFSGQLQVYGLTSSVPPPPPGSGANFVQAAAATPQSAASTVTAAYSFTQTAGNMNIVAIGWNDAVSSVASVSDSAGNAYSLAIGPTRGTNISQALYYAPNIKGGSNTVTVTFTQSASYPDVRVLEYSGVNALDAAIGSAGNSSISSSGFVTTAAANELIFAANTVFTSTQGASSPFTMRIITSPNSDGAQDYVASAAGSYSASASLGSAGPWVMQAASFISGSSQPQPNPPQVTGVSPNSGSTAGGATVSISGSNFAAGATVQFGSNPATNVAFINATSISAVTPAGPAGSVSVTVTNPSGLSATLANAYTYVASTPPPASGISFIQVAAAAPQNATAVVTVTYPSSQQAGNMNIVAIGWNDATSSIASVRDSAGNIYNLAIGPTRGTNISQAIYYASNIIGGANAVTVTFTQAAAYPDIRILEYSGVNALDVAAGSAGNTNVAGSGPVTTTAANELIFAANTVFTNTQGAGAPFTMRIITTPNSDGAQDYFASTAGQYAATAQLGSAGPWVMQTAAFIASGTQPQPVPPQINGVAPNSGSTAGGTTVTISGSNFVAGASVQFGSSAAASATVLNSTSISAITPAGAAGTVSVTVTNPGGLSATLSGGYTYVSSTPPPSNPAFWQVSSATPQSPTAVVTVNFNSLQTAGNLNIVVVGWNDTSSSVQSVQDSAGNVYSLAIGPTVGTGIQQSIYYASNIKGGSNSVTVTFNKAAAYPDIRILEYGGVSVLDAASAGFGSGSNSFGGSVTTTGTNELIFAANTVNTRVSGSGPGFNLRIITTPDGDIAQDTLAAAPGVYSATAPLSPSGQYVMQIVAFK
jgi:hypothetical protein